MLKHTLKTGLVGYLLLITGVCAVVQANEYDYGNFDSILQNDAMDQQMGFDCLIEPHAVIEVSTREEGVVESLDVKRGDIVKKGQVLVKLDSGVEQLTMELAQARAKMTTEIETRKDSLEYLKRQQERVNDLFGKKAVSFNEKDKADTDVILGESELRSALENHQLSQLEQKRAENYFARRTIYSTVDAVVVKTHLNPGESVKDRTILTLAQVDPLNVEVILPLSQYGKIKTGDKATITPLVPGGEKAEATVVIVDRVIDAASGTFGVRLELPNSDYNVPGGIRCEVDFQDRS
jgi:RND family efflux transporter MFP subunit